MTKVCSQCKLDKDESEFSKKRGGLQSKCKLCQRAYSKAHYDRNTDYYINKATKNNARFKERNRAFVNQIKESTPCRDCNRKFIAYVMDFDHLSDKVENISNLVSQCVSLETLRTEIAKCELVCANCHRIRTYNRSNGEVAELV